MVLGALIGFLFGAVAGGAAGARRTASAYDRFVAATNGADAIVGPPCDDLTCPSPADLAGRLRALDIVDAAVATTTVTAAAFARADGSVLDPSDDPCYSGSGGARLLVSPSAADAAPVSARRLLRGREGALAHEVVIAESLSRRTGLDTGDSLLIGSGSCEDGPARRGPQTLELVVVGVGVSVGDIESERGFSVGGIYATPELRPLLDTRGFTAVDGLAAVVLTPGRTPDELQAAMEEAGINARVLLGDQEMEGAVEQGLDADASTLWLFVAIGALATGVLMAPVIARSTRGALDDAPVLSCLGCTGRGLAAIGGGHGAAIALASLPFLVGTMLAVSWFMPPGRAQTLEPAGVELDLAVVVAGGAVVTAFTVAAATLASLGIGRRAPRPELQRTTAAARVARWGGLPPPATIGVRLALEPRHRSGRSPVRSGLVGLAVAAATVVGVVSYVADLDHLNATPRLAGWNWDAAGYPVDGRSATSLAEVLADTPGVARASILTFWNQPGGERPASIRAGGVDVTTFFMAFSTGPGAITPTVTAGRAPSGPTEVGLDAATLRRLKVSIGDVVELVGRRSATVSVVGEVVVPLDDQAGTQAAGTLTLEGFQRLRPGEAGDLVAFELDGTVAGADVRASLLARGYAMEVLQGAGADAGEVGSITLDQSRTLPLTLGVLLAVAGVGVLVHIQYVTSRGRRRELAVVRALGLRSGQVAGAVATQAVVLVLVAFLLGTPAGLLVGRWAWGATADRLGVMTESVVPWTGLATVVAASVMLATAASVLPAYQAARRPIADVLRSE
jgi:hypothetical protein